MAFWSNRIFFIRENVLENDFYKLAAILIRSQNVDGVAVPCLELEVWTVTPYVYLTPTPDTLFTRIIYKPCVWYHSCRSHDIAYTQNLLSISP